MTTPTTLTSSLTGITYEVHTESDDHLYVLSDGLTVLVCALDDDLQTIVEDHERSTLA
jgi:hypothetical protein